MPTETDTRRELALRSISVMADGTLEDFEEVLHPEFLNHEQKDEPPAARGIGPATAYATALWLRDAFADLRWEIHEVVAEDDLVGLGTAHAAVPAALGVGEAAGPASERQR